MEQTTFDFEGIGPRIQAARMARRMTQRDLAYKMSVPRTWISKLERNKVVPTVPSLDKVAAGLNVTVGSLLGFSPAGRDLFVEEMAPLVTALSFPDRLTVLRMARKMARAA
jgi:transcriptional regulator with XRE-family HTH domain